MLEIKRGDQGFEILRGGRAAESLVDVLDEWGQGRKVISAYLDSEAEHQVSRNVVSLDKEINLILVKTRMPKVAVKSDPLNNRAEQIPSHQIFLADTDSILDLALLNNHLPHLLSLSAVPEQHIKKNMGAVHQSVVKLLKGTSSIIC